MAKKETSTKSFVLRVDAATMDAIEKWAADEFRSTNGQLQWIIAEAVHWYYGTRRLPIFQWHPSLQHPHGGQSFWLKFLF